MKIALVTGVTSGFGLSIAKKLLECGVRVVGTGRRENILNSLQEQFKDRFLPLCFDIRNLNEVKAAIENLPNDWKDIDLLVNNAGLALGLEGADQANIDDWNVMIDTNVKGLVYITRAVLPNMVKRNYGYIINIGSIAGTYPYPGGNVYGATKAFVKQFSLNLRADLINKNIRVSNIEPGLCGDTEFSLTRFKGDIEKVNSLYNNVKYIKPDDIANIVYWLSQQPEHMNINSIEVMPTAQTFSPLNVARENI